MKTIYFIRHSAPFVEIDFKNDNWAEYNKNMILSSIGEDNAKMLCNIKELESVDEIYASNSFRAIGTAKYIAEQNHLKIKLDDRINERELGIDKLSDLPESFVINSFNNKDLKIGFGESLNDVDIRFEQFINGILKSEKRTIALFLHGIIMLSYLQNLLDFTFDGKNLTIRFNEVLIYTGIMKNPMVFQLIFDDDNVLVDIKYIEVPETHEVL